MKTFNFLLISGILAASMFFVAGCKSDGHNDSNTDTGTDTGTTNYDPLTDEGVVINGIKWATRNVDAPGTFAANPKSAGMFYQWNRKTGWSSSDPMINSDGGTEWNSSLPSGSSWGSGNDPCPQGWRVPTNHDLISLWDAKLENVQTSTHGYKFTDKNSGASVFFPAAGGRHFTDGKLGAVGLSVCYWSSTQYDQHNAYLLADPNSYSYNYDKGQGQSVRCVAE